MSHPQDSNRPFFSFGNPFRMIRPKESCSSPHPPDLLNTFEESMAGRLEKLKPTYKEDVLTLSWMSTAMESLCGIHTDIKVLITTLELPVCDWKDKWIDVYLDSSLKLLDICIAFSSEISRLNQGHLFLQCALHTVESASSNQFVTAQSSLDEWEQHVSSNNTRLDKCLSVMESFAQTLDLPKIKNSSKGNVVMKAIYRVKAITLFVCNVFTAIFSGSHEKLFDVLPLESSPWSKTFTNVQSFVNTEIRNKYSNKAATTLKEIEAINIAVKNLYPIMQDGVDSIKTDAMQESKLELEISANKLSQGLDRLAKEVDNFFQVVLTGRDALLDNLMTGGNYSELMQTS